MSRGRLTPHELRAILKAEKCDCTKGQRDRRESCTRRIIRCRGRHAWKRDNDPVFRRVWAGWFGIPTLKQQAKVKKS